MGVAVTVLTAIGIVAFALSGALMAVRKDMDVVGMFVLASITAVGGGVARDLLLGLRPAALQSPWWWILIGIAAVVVFFFGGLVDRLRRGVLACDAVGLGLFCTTSTMIALGHGLGGFEAILIGVMGGAAGGVSRDLLAGEVPAVLRRGTPLYVLPAVIGCAVVVVAFGLGLDAVWAMVVGSVLITGLRLLALWRRWRAPSPRPVQG